MNDLDYAPRVNTPPPPRVSAGVLQSQARELAEQRNQYVIAMDFPRNELQCIDNIARAFSELRTAEVAAYQYARGGTDITGPSIHAAQTIALQWGNIAFGWREISRGTGEDGKRYSEVEAYAIDLQSRVPSRIMFVVPHWRDTKGGGYALKEERDIYELCANMAQRRKRACILSVVPQQAIDVAMDQAATTLKARADTSPEAMQKMLDTFAEFGVTKAQIEARLQRHLDAIQPAQVVALKRIYIALRDGIATASDYFAPDPNAPVQGEGAAAADGTAAPAAPVSAAERVKARLRAKKGKDTPEGGAPAAGASDAPAAPVAQAGKDEAAAPAPDSDAGAPDAGNDATRGPADDEPALIDTSDAPPRADAAALRERMMKARDRDAAWLVVDSARGQLSPQDHEALIDLLEQRFPD